jgi:hypothetical protein
MLKRAAYRSVRVTRRVWSEVRKARRWLSDPMHRATHYPGEPRKGDLRIWVDHLAWIAQHRESHLFYFLHGLDRRGARNADSLPYLGSLRIVGSHNFGETTRDHYNYVCVLRDKVLFTIYASAMGHPAVNNLAELRSNGITWLPTRRSAPLTDLEALADLDGFAKPRDGRQGRGVFRLAVSGGAIHVNGIPTDVADLQKKLDQSYLLQERIVQHPRLAALHVASVNTLRLVTVWTGVKLEPFAAALRIGAHGKPVDNWAAGGIIARVDLETEELQGHGFFKPGKGTRVDRHPDSGILLDGYDLPFVGDAVNAAMRFHADLPGIHSVGWDIALTEDGPVIIEGNEYWDTGIHMATDPSFVARFRKLYGVR